MNMLKIVSLSSAVVLTVAIVDVPLAEARGGRSHSSSVATPSVSPGGTSARKAGGKKGKEFIKVNFGTVFTTRQRSRASRQFSR
jgi:hypothetical protein